MKISQTKICNIVLMACIIPYFLSAFETVQPVAHAKIQAAHVMIQPTAGNHVNGTVMFKEVVDGIEITANITGLTPGKHGFHVHEHGDCSASDGSSAGGHYNPTKSKHGGPESSERHIGDFGNLLADQNGNAHYRRVDQMISLNGPDSIIGKSIIIHADEDDLKTQPTGNSGARVACGLIEIQN